MSPVNAVSSTQATASPGAYASTTTITKRDQWLRPSASREEAGPQQFENGTESVISLPFVSPGSTSVANSATPAAVLTTTAVASVANGAVKKKDAADAGSVQKKPLSLLQQLSCCFSTGAENSSSTSWSVTIVRQWTVSIGSQPFLPKNSLVALQVQKHQHFKTLATPATGAHPSSTCPAVVSIPAAHPTASVSSSAASGPTISPSSQHNPTKQTVAGPPHILPSTAAVIPTTVLVGADDDGSASSAQERFTATTTKKTATSVTETAIKTSTATNAAAKTEEESYEVWISVLNYDVEVQGKFHYICCSHSGAFVALLSEAACCAAALPQPLSSSKPSSSSPSHSRFIRIKGGLPQTQKQRLPLPVLQSSSERLFTENEQRHLQPPQAQQDPKKPQQQNLQQEQHIICEGASCVAGSRRRRSSSCNSRRRRTASCCGGPVGWCSNSTLLLSVGDCSSSEVGGGYTAEESLQTATEELKGRGACGYYVGTEMGGLRKVLPRTTRGVLLLTEEERCMFFSAEEDHASFSDTERCSGRHSRQQAHAGFGDPCLDGSPQQGEGQHPRQKRRKNTTVKCLFHPFAESALLLLTHETLSESIPAQPSSALQAVADASGFCNNSSFRGVLRLFDLSVSTEIPEQQLLVPALFNNNPQKTAADAVTAKAQASFHPSCAEKREEGGVRDFEKTIQLQIRPPLKMAPLLPVDFTLGCSSSSDETTTDLWTALSVFVLYETLSGAEAESSPPDSAQIPSGARSCCCCFCPLLPTAAAQAATIAPLLRSCNSNYSKLPLAVELGLREAAAQAWMMQQQQQKSQEAQDKAQQQAKETASSSSSSSSFSFSPDCLFDEATQTWLQPWCAAAYRQRSRSSFLAAAGEKKSPCGKKSEEDSSFSTAASSEPQHQQQHQQMQPVPQILQFVTQEQCNQAVGAAVVEYSSLQVLSTSPLLVLLLAARKNGTLQLWASAEELLPQMYLQRLSLLEQRELELQQYQQQLQQEEQDDVWRRRRRWMASEKKGATEWVGADTRVEKNPARTDLCLPSYVSKPVRFLLLQETSLFLHHHHHQFGRVDVSQTDQVTTEFGSISPKKLHSTLRQQQQFVRSVDSGPVQLLPIPTAFLTAAKAAVALPCCLAFTPRQVALLHVRGYSVASQKQLQEQQQQHHKRLFLNEKKESSACCFDREKFPLCSASDMDSCCYYGLCTPQLQQQTIFAVSSGQSLAEGSASSVAAASALRQTTTEQAVIAAVGLLCVRTGGEDVEIKKKNQAVTQHVGLHPLQEERQQVGGSHGEFRKSGCFEIAEMSSNFSACIYSYLLLSSGQQSQPQQLFFIDIVPYLKAFFQPDPLVDEGAVNRSSNDDAKLGDFLGGLHAVSRRGTLLAEQAAALLQTVKQRFQTVRDKKALAVAAAAQVNAAAVAGGKDRDAAAAAAHTEAVRRAKGAAAEFSLATLAALQEADSSLLPFLETEEKRLQTAVAATIARRGAVLQAQLLQMNQRQLQQQQLQQSHCERLQRLRHSTTKLLIRCGEAAVLLKNEGDSSRLWRVQQEWKRLKQLLQQLPAALLELSLEKWNVQPQHRQRYQNFEKSGDLAFASVHGDILSMAEDIDSVANLVFLLEEREQNLRSVVDDVSRTVRSRIHSSQMHFASY